MFYNNTQQLAEHKLLLLYILDRFEIPLTNTQFTQFVMERDYMNYFLLQQFLGELVSSSMLEYSESEGNFFYLITEKGKNTLQFFRDRLSDELTNTLDHAVEMKKQILLKEMQILADYTKKKENEYVVDLKVIENDIVLIDLKLNVVSNKYAKEICDKWKQDAPKLYGEIIHLLIQ
ncbi:DUF4364 family protein [Geosporobacter ferrireducens]|uniref:DUF4364 domain-containing protein n=1 Tax=Geosporobacter ferrireducens TaxID=1424294 RepID=A0A1D8GD60_9FIRM|nr:DUF4364 family protein [Geosporobacter ferrireducens]AOT68845.1 hypothetical protein Gferi_04320 [Geosporobacter ferrireducens]MTI54922.1 DUF4364 family protein [Geosporobacter ferrireducens]